MAVTDFDRAAVRAVAAADLDIVGIASRAPPPRCGRGAAGAAAWRAPTGRADAGLRARACAEGDRRRQERAVTAKGRRALGSAEALLAGRLATLVGDLARPEIDALARVLPRVEASLSGA